jgi:dipeptidyl aminopeptidase/acylaminoacyl peptidase
MRFGYPLWVAAAALAWTGMTSATDPDDANISVPRAPTYEDLVSIVDIAADETLDFEGLSISPSGRLLALQIAKASLKTNEIEARSLILDLDSLSKPFDLGPSSQAPALAELGQPVGVFTPERPAWLGDSKWIVVREHSARDAQLWKVRYDGKSREQITRAPGGVLRFNVSEDGERVYFTTRVRTMAGSLPTTTKGRGGYLYDESVSPLLGMLPKPRSDANAEVFWVYDVKSRSQRLARPGERAEMQSLKSASPAGTSKHWERRASRSNASVWLEGASGQFDVQLPAKIVARVPGRGAAPVECGSERCTGYFKGLWISPTGETVFFLRWDGERDYGRMGVYAWRIGEQESRPILRTDSLLQACTFVAMQLICVQEAATKPAHVVRIDLRSGQVRVVYDPNPHFEQLRFGEIQPVNWTDPNGVEGFGHLVKPLGYQSGKRYPLVIVQYRSRGFLRGGVGDENPIHVLAAKGFAVLSFHRPDDWELLARVRNDVARERELWHDYGDRKRVLSVLRAGIRALDDRHIIDAAKVGITGLSDGANTAAYALIHSSHDFAAASVAGTYWNPILYHLAGPMLQDRFTWFELPFPEDSAANSRWKGISIALNAPAIDTPILIQVSDSELMPETQTWSALRHYGKAVEMHVFPGEGHVKARPRNRLELYRRNVQWFQYWLAGVEDPVPVDPNQYLRWAAMRSQLFSKKSE